jgi:DNA-binding LytR/AlgR family response regulator
VNKKLNRITETFKEELVLFLSISFGVFLFVLFFQPFPFVSFDFNDTLLFVSGIGAIVFLIMVLVRLIIPGLINNNNDESPTYDLLRYLNGFMILSLSSVAVIFYLRYVGLVGITFHIVFKAVIICFSSPLALGLYDLFNELKQQIELLIVEKKIVQKQVEKYEEEILNKSIEFTSEYNADNFSLLISEVAIIRSADNYVEIVYREGEIFRKKLIRNTLKNIEFQIKQYSNFIRCHRICIVNLHYIEKLNKGNSNHWLTLKGLEEQIPVSRQYLLKLREAL